MPYGEFIMTFPTQANPSWPSNRLPVELFSAIVRYLPERKDIENLRLVNREFYTKLQCEFFKHLVINVGSKLGASSGANRRCLDGSTSDDITEYIVNSDAFRHAAPFVRRIALSLDLSEQELASPEDEEKEKIEICFWGVFRWPVDPSSCFYRSRLERITQSLERAKGISHILGEATQIRELALSCDGGLGYLQGPDVNPYQPPEPQSIFGQPNYIRSVLDESQPSLQVRFMKPYKLEMIENRLASMGISEGDTPDVIQRLLETEGITMNEFTCEERKRAPLPASRYGESKITRTSSWHYGYRLHPDQLTDTQARLLYQYATAQQALVQSVLFTVARHSASYTNLTKINIVRLSSFHVSSLCLDGFWSKLPRLEEVSLAVAPDWRSVTMHTAYTVETRQVYPTDALPDVFRLLNDHIGQQPRIKRLHFEWLCGGELAPGWLQRNRYVLPAPFLKKHRQVVYSGKGNLLILPHVTHLSLKNCWFAPNVFYRTIHTMAKEHSLVTLELETVSLSGPPIFRHNMLDRDLDYKTWPIPPGVSPKTGTKGLIREPLPLSWCHVIDLLTPGPTIKQHVFAEDFPSKPELRIRKDLKLRKLAFKSCGYLTIPDSRFISNRRFERLSYPPDLRKVSRDMAKRSRSKWRTYNSFVQVNTDRHLGRINDVLDPREEYSMQVIFGLRTSWLYAYDFDHFRAAAQDGIAYPGLGRFSGTIDGDSFMDVDSFMDIDFDDDDDDDDFDDDGNNGNNGNNKNVAKAYEYSTKDFDFDYADEDEVNLDSMVKQFESEMGYKFPAPNADANADGNGNTNANANANGNTNANASNNAN
ncbi:hypothetical protein F4814DRAFT_459255 [Daldinia grandis]|nr:hypothetical protein F4814DRAFT_459255 [Daldinia grandis]